MAEPRRPTTSNAILQISGLNVYYGHSHALQGVDLTLEQGVLSVVGRNGMGKTTLCKTIMGLVRASSGSIRMNGQDLLSLQPAQIARLGVGYVPQGRRLWRSLTVDEHLRLSVGTTARRLERGAHLRHVSAPGRTQEQRRRPALRRRAADARDLAGAADQSATADHGRADRRPGPGHRQPGRRDAGRARRRRRHRHPGHRAEHRRGDLGVRQGRDHGQRADQPHHRRAATGRRSRIAAAPARRRPPLRSRAGSRRTAGGRGSA